MEQSARFKLLDITRGFALLGILLVNIIGFGLHSSAYLNPGFDVVAGWNPDTLAWISIELFAEGAMRCLFSMLFGAGVVLYSTGAHAKSGRLHYKRTGWLFLFGLCNAYVLLWNGDILVTYAIAGAILYLFRNLRARTLIGLGSLLIILLSTAYGLIATSLKESYRLSQAINNLPSTEVVDPGLEAGASAWEELAAELEPLPVEIENELQQRRTSYASVFKWNSIMSTEMILFIIPIFLLWDALAMMFFGMAFLKLNILQGERSHRFYLTLMIVGFSVGLLFNGFEVLRSVRHDMELLSVVPIMQPTYHFGRLGIAFGYIGLLGLAMRRGPFRFVSNSLAAVGRLALTNYLMQSALCAFIFTGAGLALVGELNRAMLYPVVLAIWILQIGFSHFWLKHFRFGPMEWLWRFLTYGRRPAMRAPTPSSPSSGSAQ